MPLTLPGHACCAARRGSGPTMHAQVCAAPGNDRPTQHRRVCRRKQPPSHCATSAPALVTKPSPFAAAASQRDLAMFADNRKQTLGCTASAEGGAAHVRRPAPPRAAPSPFQQPAYRRSPPPARTGLPANLLYVRSPCSRETQRRRCTTGPGGRRRRPSASWDPTGTRRGGCPATSRPTSRMTCVLWALPGRCSCVPWP